MALRDCRPLVVLTALALSGCPFNFKFNVENRPGDAVTSRPDAGEVAVVSAGTGTAAPPLQSEAAGNPKRPPGE